MEFTSLIISVLALGFSVFSFLMNYKQKQELEATKLRLDSAMFDINRDSVFEARLADWPEALKFHGIDFNEVKNDGLTTQQVVYMILSVNALISYCEANSVTVYDQLKQSDYRQRMFAQPESRRAWKYARLCFPKSSAESLDKYLIETYGEKYETMQ